MKKYLISLFVLGIFAFSFQAHASVLSDALLKIENLTKELTELKSQLGASVGGVFLSGTSTGDTTPRIMYWYSKVNQHIDSNGVWQTDTDGVSGANIDKLTYCKKFWPNTVSVSEYKKETINTWKERYNLNNHTATQMSYKCVEEETAPSVTVLSPNGGESYKPGNKIGIYLSGGLTGARVGLVYPDFDPEALISDGNDVHWLSVSSNAGKNFVWDGSSFIDNNGNKNYWNVGTGNYKMLAIRDTNDSKCYKTRISNCSYDLSDNYFTIRSNSDNLPDLTTEISSVVVSSEDYGITVYGTIINSGSDTEKFPYRFLYSDEPDGKGFINYDVKKPQVYELNSNDQINIDEKFSFYNPGNYSVRLCADQVNDIYGDGGKIKESNESNNCSGWFNFKIEEKDSLIKLLSPNGGEIYKVGDTIKISWKDDKVKNSYPNYNGSIKLYNDSIKCKEGSIGCWSSFSIDSISYNDNGVYLWDTTKKLFGNAGPNTVKVDSGEKYKIKICFKDDKDVQNCDLSDNYFTFKSKNTINSNLIELKDDSVSNLDVINSQRTLKVGVKGDDVKTLQAFLGITADGSFGPITRSKVMEWQVSNGLTPDGLFGNMSKQKAGILIRE